jgi:hypothetical protein
MSMMSLDLSVLAYIYVYMYMYTYTYIYVGIDVYYEMGIHIIMIPKKSPVSQIYLCDGDV